MAKEIAAVAKQLGAEPVGVFVDQTLDQIHSICQETGIQTIQLHGDITKQALHGLVDDYTVIYSISVEQNGFIDKPLTLPNSVICLFDNPIGGSGVPFEWKSFSPPQLSTWILAGGLNPSNVAEAITLLRPSAVDVATGVEYPNTTRKNPKLLKAFIQAAKKENL